MISWLIDTLIGVTLLMLVVLAARRPVARFFGAGWAYALWLLPALRLVLPPLPLPRIGGDIPLPPITVFIPAMDGVTAPLPASAGPGQWVPFMLALWAGGAVTFLLWHWLSYRAFLQALKANSRPGDPPSYGGIPTLASDAVDGPLALGVIERRIVLPGHFRRRYNERERRLAMEHELVHHRRGDIWWNLAGLFILALNWFNPIAWLAFHAFRSDQELACDAAVAKRATGEERHDYARALVKSASRPGLIAACPLNRADELKRRLRMIRSHRGGKARMAGGVAAFATLLVTLAFSNVAPAETERQIVALAEQPAQAWAPAARPPMVLASARPEAVPAVRAAVRGRALTERRNWLLALTRDMAVQARLEQAEFDARRFATVAEAIAAARARAQGQPEGQVQPRLRQASVETAEPAPYTLVRMASAETGAAATDVRLRLKPARSGRVVSFQVEGNVAHVTVAGGWTPERLTAVQAAIERAMAEADDATTREQLGHVMAALERRKDKLGMVTSHN